MRFLTVFLLASSTALTTAWLYGSSSADTPAISMQSIEANGQRLRKMGQRIKAFRGFLSEVLPHLEDGSLHLRDAAMEVQEYASTFHPSYLTHLAFVEDGETTLLLVARNLITHFERTWQPSEKRRLLLERLRKELEEIENSREFAS